MSELIRDVRDFFYFVQAQTQDLGNEIIIELSQSPLQRLKTFRGTEHRRKGRSLEEFLEFRWEKRLSQSPDSHPKPGGIWLGRQCLFDVDLESHEEGSQTIVTRCDCGFYAIVDLEDKQMLGPVRVALRYEADFANLGSMWAAHPTFHLQWEPPRNSNVLTGATQSRLRVDPMLPTHFFEFCTRHFVPDVWTKVFHPVSQEIVALTEKIHTETEQLNDADRVKKVDDYREQARRLTNQIQEKCDPMSAWTWRAEESSKLAL